ADPVSVDVPGEQVHLVDGEHDRVAAGEAGQSADQAAFKIEQIDDVHHEAAAFAELVQNAQKVAFIEGDRRDFIIMPDAEASLADRRLPAGGRRRNVPGPVRVLGLEGRAAPGADGQLFHLSNPRFRRISKMNRSIFRLSRVNGFSSWGAMGVTRIGCMPIRLAPNTSVSSWSPTTAVCSGDSPIRSSALRNAPRSGFLAEGMNATPTASATRMTRSRRLLDTTTMLNPLPRTVASHSFSFGGAPVSLAPTSVLSRSAMMPRMPADDSASRSIS